MGLAIHLKGFAPLIVYVCGMILTLMAMTGRVRPALMLVAFILPLRNVIDRLLVFPLGNQFIDILLLGAIIGWFVNTNTNKRQLIDKSGINSIAAVLAVFIFISLILGSFYLYGTLSLSLHDSRVTDCKNFILFPIIFFIYFNNIREKKDVQQIFIIMCISVAIVAYYTGIQINSFGSSLVSREKIKSTFQFLGPNEIAGFLNTFTIILMSVFYFTKNSKIKIFYFFLILINLFCIAFLYSRGAYAGLCIGLLILFALKDQKMLVPLVLMLVLWQSVLPEKVVERIKQTKSESGGLDISSQRRINVWSQAIDLFKSNPVTGIGYGSFRKLGYDLGDTHNIYVKILCEQGLVGFTIFLVLLFSFMKEGFTLYQKGEDDHFSKGLGLGFFICIFVLMVNNFFGDRWSYLEPNAYLWIFAGLVARLNLIAEDHQQAMTAKPVKKAAVNTEKDKQHIKKRIRYYDPPERT